MRKSPHKLIVVIGNIATGKTTLTDLLARQLPARKVKADDLYTINPFFPLAVKDRAKWSLASDLWFLYERMKLVRPIRRYLQETHVVVDSGLLMSCVYAHSRLESGYFTNDEWEMYQTMYDELTKGLAKPNLVVHLQASIETLRKRIKKRGRKFEIKHHTRDYLTSLSNSLRVMERKFEKQGMRTIPIDVEKNDFTRNRNIVGLESLLW